MFGDRKSRLSFGSSDVGYGTNTRRIGRMYTSPSMDRLSSMDSSRSALLSRAKSIYDLSTTSEATVSSMSSPIVHRNTRYQNMRTNVWRQSQNSKTLPNRPSFHRSRHDLHSSDSYSSLSSVTQSPNRSRFADPIAVLDRRDQFFSQLNAIGSPKVNRKVLPQLANRSAVRYHWPMTGLTGNDATWRPRLRERPLLSNLSTTIHSRSKKCHQSSDLSCRTTSTSSPKVDDSNSPERRDSSAGIYRNKYIIKFREHNLGQTASQRRSSITWDLPKAFSPVKGSDQSPISEQLEPDPHLETKDAESESVSEEINESKNSGTNQDLIKNESKQSERVSDEEELDKQVCSGFEPKEHVTQLVVDILSVHTASVMPEPKATEQTADATAQSTTGPMTGHLVQRALTLKSKTSNDINVESVPKNKSPKKKKVKKKEQTIKEKGLYTTKTSLNCHLNQCRSQLQLQIRKNRWKSKRKLLIISRKRLIFRPKLLK